tara:strand:+ start:629 stop:1084 length:456 start_codon:yes stop_codon:yes gene_type:complete
MFDQQNIIRLFSIISYLGFTISAITGFIELNTDFTLSMLMTSIVVILSVVPITILDIKNQFIWSDKQMYYIRSVILLHYSLLSLGLTNIGIGFGIYGIIMFVINLLSGVFEIHTQYTDTQNDIEHSSASLSTSHTNKAMNADHQPPFNQSS